MAEIGTLKEYDEHIVGLEIIENDHFILKE